MEEVKRNDLIFFRNDILQDIKKIEVTINEKISDLTKQFQNTNLINDQKFELYKEKYNEVLKKADTSDFQKKINDKFEKQGKKIEDSIINNNVRIQKIEKDLADSCYKYDKLYIKNMSSPGLIGDGCPFQTMKTFFVYVDKKIKELIGISNKIFNDFNSLKSYLDKTMESFEKQMEKRSIEMDKYNEEKLKNYEKKIEDKKKYLEDRFEHIRVENSNYIYNIIKNQEIINEKLKLEIKKYSVINETLIEFYKKQKKAETKNNKLGSNYKYLLNSKSSKKNQKKMSLNINEVLPAIQKIEENYKFNDILYKNQDQNESKIKMEDSHFEEKDQKGLPINQNFVKNNDSLLLRRCTIGNINYQSNLFYPNLNIYKDDTIRTLFQPSKISEINRQLENKFKTVEKQIETVNESNTKLITNDINNVKNINNVKSEKKLFTKTYENIIPIQLKKSIMKEENEDKNKEEYKNEFTNTTNIEYNKDNYVQFKDHKNGKEDKDAQKDKENKINKIDKEGKYYKEHRENNIDKLEDKNDKNKDFKDDKVDMLYKYVKNNKNCFEDKDEKDNNNFSNKYDKDKDNNKNNNNKKDKTDKDNNKNDKFDKDNNKNDKFNKDEEDHQSISKNNFININNKIMINEERIDAKRKEEKESFDSKEIKREKEVIIKEYKIKDDKRNNITINNNNISYSLKEENKYRNNEIKIDKTINQIYKYIEKNNEETNKKIDIINRHINYLLKEILIITKNKNKLKNNINLKNTSNSHFENNINLSNLYISNNSILPLKTQYTNRLYQYSEKSNSFNNNENKNTKKGLNRVINISQNNHKNKNINDDYDIENYCFVLSKIEPYLIRKFDSYKD